MLKPYTFRREHAANHVFIMCTYCGVARVKVPKEIMINSCIARSEINASLSRRDIDRARTARRCTCIAHGRLAARCLTKGHGVEQQWRPSFQPDRSSSCPIQSFERRVGSGFPSSNKETVERAGRVTCAVFEPCHAHSYISTHSTSPVVLH